MSRIDEIRKRLEADKHIICKKCGHEIAGRYGDDVWLCECGGGAAEGYVRRVGGGGLADAKADIAYMLAEVERLKEDNRRLSFLCRIHGINYKKDARNE